MLCYLKNFCPPFSSFSYRWCTQMLQNYLNMTIFLLTANPHDTKIIPVEAAVSENNNVSLTCTTTSKPAASVEWYRDYNYLSRINNSTNYAITQREVEIVANESVIESTLVIINSQLKDIGNYTCKAVGKIGFQYAHSELTVHCKQ